MALSAPAVILFGFRLLFTCELAVVWSQSSRGHIDQSTYEDGKKQYEIIQHRAELPRYGQCWKDAMIQTQTGCAQLTDEVQGRLALSYLNCFLQLQGRPSHHCTSDQSLEECTQVMDDADRASLTTFFTHTQNICYFLRAQVWNEATEKTIASLAESSLQVASQLHESSRLQAEMIKQQNDSLKNQKILMENAANLTNTLSNSSDEINHLFQTFKETTHEQRLLITDVFDQLTSLKQTVLGEFSGFYSILYYFFSVLVCYLLTSTTRTSGARFWLFSIVTTSIFCEYIITAWLPSLLTWTSVDFDNHDDWVYWLKSSCRKLFACIGLIVLGLCAYYYQDINIANNKLLVEIRKQNSDLTHLLCGVSFPLPGTHSAPNGYAVGLTSGKDGLEEEESRSEYSHSETHSQDSDSDRTYILQETEPSVSETDSYMTAETVHGASVPSLSRSESLMQELRDLRCATPLKEMSGQMERWIHTGAYSQDGPYASNSNSNANTSSSGTPYYLRPRKGRLTNFMPPAAEVESPQSFAKTVRQLERIAEKNSRMVCAAITAKRNK